eukprot:TRINITY_DN680_c2_g1_i1.p2 TRINITY_DN680_c2_g1~~TRINITY_DN680_c2_g1_i1.p2  ORF type:complete len:174 (+),score=52.41 TRINITY_DN680_c2_g1_i1:157-678(+)
MVDSPRRALADHVEAFYWNLQRNQAAAKAVQEGTLPLFASGEIEEQAEDHEEVFRRLVAEKRRLGMDFVDSLLLFLPAFPLMVSALLRKDRGVVRYSFLWLAAGAAGACVKFLLMKPGNFCGVFVSPAYIFLAEALGTGRIKRGAAFGLAYFVLSLAALRIGGSVRVKGRKQQ